MGKVFLAIMQTPDESPMGGGQPLLWDAMHVLYSIDEVSSLVVS